MPVILSIQSHVVHGHVGNKSATLPLQLQDWDVLPLNTTQYSNHPGHGSFTGQKATDSEISSIFQGLESIGVAPDVVLTGYVPSAQVLREVGRIATKLTRNNGSVWVLDPVLGDHGRIYVSEENIEIYKELLKSGDVRLVTPNQLELEVLSGVKVNDLESLKTAVKSFMDLYKVENLVVSSIELENVEGLVSVGATRSPSNELKVFKFELKRINASFSGSGDLFSALLTSAWFKNGFDLVDALGEALSIVEKVLELTYKYKVQSYKLEGKPIPEKLVIHDLNIVQARNYYTEHLQSYKPSDFF